MFRNLLAFLLLAVAAFADNMFFYNETAAPRLSEDKSWTTTTGGPYTYRLV